MIKLGFIKLQSKEERSALYGETIAEIKRLIRNYWLDNETASDFQRELGRRKGLPEVQALLSDIKKEIETRKKHYGVKV